MIWLIAKILPIKALIRLILIGLIVAGAAIGMGVVDPAVAQSSAISDDTELPFRHSSSVTWESVEVDGGEAVLTITSEQGGERILITDISREGTGVLPKEQHTLDRGENVIWVALVNPDDPGVTVDVEDGRMFQWVEDTSLEWLPDAGHAVPITIGAGVLALVLLAGLHLVQTKGQTTAENPIK
jgi:hypothetical protein